VTAAGRSRNRAIKLLATPTVNAPTNTPSSGRAIALQVCCRRCQRPGKQYPSSVDLVRRNRIINAQRCDDQRDELCPRWLVRRIYDVRLTKRSFGDLASQRYAKTNRQKQNQRSTEAGCARDQIAGRQFAHWLQSTSIPVSIRSNLPASHWTLQRSDKNVSPAAINDAIKPRSVSNILPNAICAVPAGKQADEYPIPADTAISRNPPQEIWMPLPKKDQRRVQ